MVNLIIVDLIIIVLCFFCIFSSKKWYLQIFILILGYGRIHFEIALEKILLNGILGFIFSMLGFKLTYGRFWERHGGKVKFLDKIQLFFSVAVEEIVWRVIVFEALNGLMAYFGIYSNYFIYAFFISVIFVLIHEKRTVEMFIYSYILCIGNYLLPGINFGLHLGRNYYIYEIQDENIN